MISKSVRSTKGDLARRNKDQFEMYFFAVASCLDDWARRLFRDEASSASGFLGPPNYRPEIERNTFPGDGVEYHSLGFHETGATPLQPRLESPISNLA